jgi:hypothetical protein
MNDPLKALSIYPSVPILLLLQSSLEEVINLEASSKLDQLEYVYKHMKI